MGNIIETKDILKEEVICSKMHGMGILERIIL